MAERPKIPFDILFEDDSIIVVDKPAGMIVHPAPGHVEGAMTEFLVKLFPEMRVVGSVERPGVVHRLDIGTSGVMVFAKTRQAYLALRREFERHERVGKIYLAVLHGAPARRQGTIESSIGRGHQRAVTRWRVLGRVGPLALAEFKIDTGRMHQIRIHAAELGCPIVGDTLYGDAAKDRRLRRRPSRQLLHAAELSFLHPVTGRLVTFSSPPPPDIVYPG